MNNIYSERIDGITANIIPVYAGDKNLTLMVVTEQPAYHGDTIAHEKIMWTSLSALLESQDLSQLLSHESLFDN